MSTRALAGALSARRQGRHLVAAAATSILFSVVGYHTLHGQTTRFISYIVMCVCFCLFLVSLFVGKDYSQEHLLLLCRTIVQQFSRRTKLGPPTNCNLQTRFISQMSALQSGKYEKLVKFNVFHNVSMKCLPL